VQIETISITILILIFSDWVVCITAW